MQNMIMKYLICPKSEFKIDVVLKKVNERTLKQILDKFIDKEGKALDAGESNIEDEN